MRNLVFLLVVLSAITGSATAQIAVRGETVYTMAGDPIFDGVEFFHSLLG